jgi:two-component system, sensor histidine kinase PdtaS
MSTLRELLAEHTQLHTTAVDHLQRLVGEWQLLSDLSFSDLALWVRINDQQLLCIAQVRPTTGATVWPDDLVTRVVPDRSHPLAGEAWRTGQLTGGEVTTLPNHTRAKRVVVPVRFRGEVIAVMNRDIALTSHDSSRLETVYLQSAEDLLQMVAAGTFPPEDLPSEIITGPRAGDGLIRLNPDGRVTYATPNALSAYHRLGFTEGLIDVELADQTKRLIPDPFDAAELAKRIRQAVDGTPTLRMEVEARTATVVFRAMPLRTDGESLGALVLVRDVTEVRRRDRALLTKDATIREIHHRVKNNLQTVAALLRLQARRSDQRAVRRALQESTRRVATIALIHETLSTSLDDRVDMDQIVDRLVPLIVDVSAVASENAPRVVRVGSFGVLSPELATPLVMVLAEVVQNAMQHAYLPEQTDGLVLITADRTNRSLDVLISDDGLGLPTGFSLDHAGLGLQIVRTLVTAELQGSIEMNPSRTGGTEVMVTVPMKGRK